MNLPAGLVQWSGSEAAAVNEFLDSKVGKKWLAVLYSRKPKVDLRTTESAALSGALSAGYESFFNEIAATRAQVTSTESYSAKSIDPVRD